MAIGDILVRVGADIGDYQRNMKTASNIAIGFGATVAGASAKVAAGFAAMSAASAFALYGVVSTASAYESAFAGVRKTVDGTEEDFSRLSKEIRQMAKEIPMTTEEIAGIAEVAGQLGIKTDDIMQFTRVMADLGVATNMSSEEAATSLARLANITGMSMNDIDRLGSTVVHLGNNLATTEREIVEMGLRLAGAGKQVGLTEDQILSFAGALSSVGIRAEAGGTAFSRVFLEMNTAVMSGGKELERFARVAGMSANDFSKAFEKDASQAILTFIQGLSSLQEDGENTAQVLADLGLGEVRVRDALLRAAGASDVFAESLELGNQAWEENTALTDEAQERYNTFASKVTILKNRLKDLVLTIGMPLLDVFSDLIDALDPAIRYLEGLAEKFENLDDDVKRTISIFIALIPVIFAVGAIFFALVAIVGLVIAGIGGLVAAGAAIGLSFSGVGLILAVIIGVIQGLIFFVGGLVSALIMLWQNSETFRDKMSAAFKAVWEVISWVFEQIVTLAQEIWAKLVEFWEENGELIVSATENIFNTLYEIFSDIFGALWEKTVEVWPEIKAFILRVVEGILEIVKIFAAVIEGDWNTLWESVENLTDVTMQNLQFIVEIGLGLLVGIVKTVFVLILESFKRAWENIREFSSDVLERLIEVVKRKFKEIVNGALDRLENLFPGVKKLWGEVESFLDGISLYQIGLNIIQGLARGLTGNPRIIMNAVRTVASAIKRGFTNFFSIQSPSVLMRDEIGKMIGLGLADGMLAEIRAVERAADELSMAALPSLPSLSDYNLGEYSATVSTRLRAEAGENHALEMRTMSDERIASAVERLERKIENMRIEMDRREVGRLVADPVTEVQERRRRVINRSRD